MANSRKRKEFRLIASRKIPIGANVHLRGDLNAFDYTVEACQSGLVGREYAIKSPTGTVLRGIGENNLVRARKYRPSKFMRDFYKNNPVTRTF